MSENNNEDVYAFKLQKEIVEVLNIRKPVILDVGANVGQTVNRYKAIFPSAQIFAFEPIQNSYLSLKKNTQKFKNVSCFQVALGEREGSVEMYNTKNPAASSILKPEDFVAKLSKGKNYDYEKTYVEMKAIDHFGEEKSLPKINILKLDIQGYELCALKGANGYLSQSHIDIVYTEVWFARNYENQCFFFDISSFLYNYGYTIADFTYLDYTQKGCLWVGDAVFISRDVSTRISKMIKSTRERDPYKRFQYPSSSEIH